MKKIILFLVPVLFLIFSFQASASCSIYDLKINATNTQSFIDEIPSINDQLEKCPVQLPSPADKFVKNDVILVKIKEENEDKSFRVFIEDSKLTKIEEGDGEADYIFEINESDFDSILQSEDKMGTFAYLHGKKKVKMRGVGFFNQFKMFVANFFIGFAFNKIQTPVQFLPSQVSEDVGFYPGYKACEFYQIKKTHVNCNAYGAAANFCAIVMQRRDAEVMKCENGGIIVCAVPCESTQKYLSMKRCAYDNERPRGAQAPPLDFCTEKEQPKQEQLKRVGEVCGHGGECETGNCVSVGQGPPWIFECSCDPFKYVPTDTSGKCPPGSQVKHEQAHYTKKVGEVCAHGGECETGNCVAVAPGSRTMECSCDPFKYVPADTNGNCPPGSQVR